MVARRTVRRDAERLRRDPDGGWTAADVPLLDEAAELLGVDDRAARALAAARRRQEIEHAQDVLDILAGSATQEADDVADLENADRLSAWTSSTRPGWPSGRRSSTTGSWPSGPPPTGPGRTGT